MRLIDLRTDNAIVASTAIPAAFPPVKLEHRFLADGAITCNTPVVVAVGLGANRLVVLPTGYACALETPPRGAIACALHALTLLIARQLLHELGALASDIEFCVAPPLSAASFTLSFCGDGRAYHASVGL